MKIGLLFGGWFFGFILISCNGEQYNMKKSAFQNPPVIEKKSTTGPVIIEVDDTVTRTIPKDVINAVTRPVPKAVANTVDYSIDDILICRVGSSSERTFTSYLGQLEDGNYQSIPHIEITRGVENDRHAFLLTKESVKKYFPDFMFDQIYLYDDLGFLTDITDFVHYEIELLGYQPTIYLVFRIPKEMEMYLKDRDDLLISTIKIDGPLYDTSFVSTEKVDYEFGTSVANVPVDESAQWFEISNGINKYISFNPSLYEDDSEDDFSHEYHFYEIIDGKGKRIIFDRKNIMLGSLKYLNLKVNEKPVLEASLYVYEGHSESTWYIYYNGSNYVYSGNKFD